MPTPNVLIVITDDQAARGTLVPSVMPAAHRWFVREGTAFTEAYATTPLCCPSRASVMTGQYAHNHRVRQNGGAHGPRALDQATTVQVRLQEAGYRTAIAGKYFNHWDLEDDPPGFDEWAIFGKGYEDVEANVDGRVRRLRRYSTDFVAARALRFLDEAERDDDTPWFLYLAPFAPHGPSTPAPRHAAAPVPAWRPSPAVGEAERSDKPPHVRDSKANLAYARIAHEAELRSLFAVDDLVAALADRLRALGEERETLAFFMSDNAHLLGEHGVQDKAAPYTEGVRVPFAMRWPAGGVEPGARDTRLVGTLDVAPTVYEATGVAPHVALDGRSLLGETARRRLLLEAWRSERTPTWASLRGRDFQYVEYYGPGRRVAFREYYDLRTDPWQLENLLADGSPAGGLSSASVSRLSAELAALRDCSGVSGARRCP